MNAPADPPETIPVRRQDRAQSSPEWIEQMLRRAPVATFAFPGPETPHLNSNLFVFDSATRTVYFHTARSGRTAELAAAGPRVAMQVWSMGRLLPAETALEFSVEYAGVTVEGPVRLLSGDEAAAALQKLLDKYFPHLVAGRDYREITPQELARTAVYALSVERWSGKSKQVGDPFPGAFRYPVWDPAKLPTGHGKA
jgi:nitroimidazol reductase NimA-like FMN-containing flavoprotein (pyridoxamine 5'-phosphate oxidase superfamily)